MRTLLFCLLLASLPAVAQVYTYVDEEGNRVFTDQPKPGNAKRIELAPSNAMTPQRGAPLVAPPAPIPREQGYQVLRILIPEPDATVTGDGSLIVTATSDPVLRDGHNYRLVLDGNVQGEPGRSPVFPLSNLDRGTHQLAVEIIDTQGRVVERTPNQPVHVKRVSLDQKRRVNPCKKADWGVRPECPLKDKPKEPDKGIIGILPFL